MVVELRALRRDPPSQPIPRAHPSRPRQRGSPAANEGQRAGPSGDAPSGLRRAVRSRRGGRSYRRRKSHARASAHRVARLGGRHRLPSVRQPRAHHAGRPRDRAARPAAFVGRRPHAFVRRRVAFDRARHDRRSADGLRTRRPRRDPRVRPDRAAPHAAHPLAIADRAHRHLAAHRDHRRRAGPHRVARRVRGHPAAVQRAQQRALGRPHRLCRDAVGSRASGARERARSVRSAPAPEVEVRGAGPRPRRRRRGRHRPLRRRPRPDDCVVPGARERARGRVAGRVSRARRRRRRSGDRVGVEPAVVARCVQPPAPTGQASRRSIRRAPVHSRSDRSFASRPARSARRHSAGHFSSSARSRS